MLSFCLLVSPNVCVCVQTDRQRALPYIRRQKIYSVDKGGPIDFRKSYLKIDNIDYLEGFLNFSL